MNENSEVDEPEAPEEEDPQDCTACLKERLKKYTSELETVDAGSKNASAENTAGGMPSRTQRRRLFLVPTGVPGVNDHTLDTPVAAAGNEYLWGFCEGLLTRIFAQVRPGDIFLMTGAGSGEFNRIARVKTKKIVAEGEADKFWSRMSFSMGGTSKSDVGFPLLCLLDKPLDVEWDKKMVMQHLGYNDHLQSSRRITEDKIDSDGGQLVFKCCLDELGLSECLTDAEIALDAELKKPKCSTAKAMAQNDKRTLLVDMDYKPNLYYAV